MIRTLDYGVLPIANSTKYINDTIVDTVETCDGNIYAVKRAFSGGLVAVKLD